MLVQSANSVPAVAVQGGTTASRIAVEQSMTATPGAVHIQCLPISAASGISVLQQPADTSVLPTQPTTIRMLQTAQAQPRVRLPLFL